MLQRAGMRVDWLPEPEHGAPPDRPWSAVSPELDADQTTAVLDHVDWLVVDHYGLDARWETSLRSTAEHLLAIDDLPDRPHDVDLLLDQNLGAPDRTELLPSRARQLLGPKYALLRPEFAQARRDRVAEDVRNARLLVFFGGGDPRSLTTAVVAALRERMPATAIDAIVTSTYPDLHTLAALADGPGGLAVHVDTDAMAELMSKATLMVGAAGSTSWERCATGLPAATVTMADNQEAIARATARARATVHLGRSHAVSSAAIADAAAGLLRHPGLLARMSQRALQICDGLGAERVARYLGVNRPDGC
jgi:UDP-2,4-diacetamido-2,4,6-trideoxy-beta-L-altropyranose hydrolase